MTCVGGSVPRERALMVVLDRMKPNWRHLWIHESSPASRGVSPLLAKECPRYTPTQYFSNIPYGMFHNEVRCENIESQTFSDESFDIVITQDVMEHIFRHDLAYAEIYRTLRKGGMYIHTAPIYGNLSTTSQKARLQESGEVQYLEPPEYHGNPIDAMGSLVTYHLGRDFPDLIASYAPFAVEVTRFNDRHHGIVAEFTEVIVCSKI